MGRSIMFVSCCLLISYLASLSLSFSINYEKEKSKIRERIEHIKDPKEREEKLLQIAVEDREDERVRAEKFKEEAGQLINQKNDEQEIKRGLLFRRALRTRIEAIETEFYMWKLQSEIIREDSKLLTEWTSQKYKAPYDKGPTTYVHSKNLKINNVKTIFDVIQDHRENHWYFYLENPPPVDTMPIFSKFRERLTNEKILTNRQAARGIARAFRILSSPFHEEGDIILDQFPLKKKISTDKETQQVLSTLEKDLDLEEPKTK